MKSRIIKPELPKMETISVAKVQEALDVYRKRTPDNTDEERQLTFEYLIGSFFPNVLENMKQHLATTATENFIAGYNARKEEEENET